MLTHEPLGGGNFLPPLYVCRDISVTSRANRLKLCIPSHATILQLLLKKIEIRRIFFRYGRFCDVATRNFWSKIDQTSRVCERHIFERNCK